MEGLDRTTDLLPAMKPESTEERLAYRAEIERLGDEIAELAAHMHAATYRLLVRLREFDRAGGWGRGFRSCAHWLSWRTGIDLGAAREKVRVARALEKLPLLSDELRTARLSYAVVRAITRVATPENEAKLVEAARHGTASHVERIVRAWRRVDRLEEQAYEQKQHESRSLTLQVDEDGMVVVRGRLPAEIGALLERALDIAQAQLYRTCAQSPARADDMGAPVGQPASDREVVSPSAVRDPLPATRAQRRADAVALIAECALRALAEAPPAGEGCMCEKAEDCASAVATRPGAARKRPRGLPLRRSDRFQVWSCTWMKRRFVPARTAESPRSKPAPTFPRKRPDGSRATRAGS